MTASRGYGAAYCGLVAASVVLPSAKIYQFNVKLALAAALVGFGLFAWRGALSDHFTRLHLAALAFIAGIVACWSLVAIRNGFDPLPEVRSMLGPFILIAAFHPRLVPTRWLLDTYFVCAVVYSLLKLAVIYALYRSFLDESTPVLTGFAVFDIHLAIGPTCTAGAPDRMTLPNDLAVALFPLLLLHARYRRPSLYAAVVLCGLAVLDSYSRYLVLAYLCVCAVAMWQLAPIRAKAAMAGALALTLGLGHVLGGANCLVQRMLPSMDPVPAAEKHAPGAEKGGASMNLVTDNVRKTQFERLREMWAKKPLVGHGVGSYDPGYLRSERLPYAYELQLLSFGAKFGAIGLALLALGALALCALHFGRHPAAWAVLAVLAASGLTNPFYESTALGVAFILTAVTFGRWTSRS